MQTTAAVLKTLQIKEIAVLIETDWVKMSPHASPFVDAMFSLATINDKFYADSGMYVVSYFLSNAGTWKGETAKLVKAELKARCVAYEKARK